MNIENVTRKMKKITFLLIFFKLFSNCCQNHYLSNPKKATLNECGIYIAIFLFFIPDLLSQINFFLGEFEEDGGDTEYCGIETCSNSVFEKETEKVKFAKF